MSEQDKDFLDEMTEGAEPEVVEPAKPEGAVQATSEPKQEPEKVEPKADAPTATEPHKDSHVPLAALLDEREKRQQAQRERDELRQRLDQAAQQPQQPNVDIWQDPDAFVQSRVQPIAAGLQNRFLNALEAQTREVYPDYDEKFAATEEFCRANPGAGQQILAQSNPALAAYKMGKQLLELKAIGDPVAYRAKVEAEVRAKIESERVAEDAKRKQIADTLPPDLSASRSVKGTELPPPEDVFDNLFEGSRQ